MKIITLRIEKKLIEEIDYYVEIGMFLSRSSFIREAIHFFLDFLKRRVQNKKEESMVDFENILNYLGIGVSNSETE